MTLHGVTTHSPLLWGCKSHAKLTIKPILLGMLGPIVNNTPYLALRCPDPFFSPCDSRDSRRPRRPRGLHRSIVAAQQGLVVAAGRVRRRDAGGLAAPRGARNSGASNLVALGD